MKRITLDWKACTGCRLCAESCSLAKTGTVGLATARIWPMHFSADATYIPVVCTQCAEAWCLKACPARAIVREGPRQTVRVLEDRCTGCRACTLACPFGAITYHPQTEVAMKCDECDGDPICTRLCPTGAIRYEEQGAAIGRTRQAWAARLLSAATPEDVG